MSVYSQTDAVIKEALINLHIATVGSCSCITKTPDPKYHSELCRYKQLISIINQLQQLL
jgi:hypothetical protein